MHSSVSVQTVFGNHIRQLREHAGLTVEQLSEKSGFSSRRLRAIERGRVNLNLGTMLILAMSLDTTLQEFLSGVAPELRERKLLAARIIPFAHYRKGQQNNCRQFGSAVPRRANRFSSKEFEFNA
jgi:transcriptional regulator with XRE-family HTH domain